MPLKRPFPKKKKKKQKKSNSENTKSESVLSPNIVFERRDEVPVVNACTVSQQMEEAVKILSATSEDSASAEVNNFTTDAHRPTTDDVLIVKCEHSSNEAATTIATATAETKTVVAAAQATTATTSSLPQQPSNSLVVQ